MYIGPPQCILTYTCSIHLLGDSLIEGRSKSQKSFYPIISVDAPMLAVILNNTKFEGFYSDKPRGKGSYKDVDDLKSLEKFGFVFDNMCLENCTADEMKALMKIIAESDKIVNALKSRIDMNMNMQDVFRKLKNKDSGTTRILGNDHQTAFNCIFKNVNQNFENTVLSILEKPLSEYYGLCVCIMTHGEENDILIGSDGEHVPLNEIASCFNAQNCSALLNKPKIFLVEACRGEKDDPVISYTEGRSLASSNKQIPPTSNNSKSQQSM